MSFVVRLGLLWLLFFELLMKLHMSFEVPFVSNFLATVGVRTHEQVDFRVTREVFEEEGRRREQPVTHSLLVLELALNDAPSLEGWLDGRHLLE